MSKLSWSHFLQVIPIEDDLAHNFYLTVEDVKNGTSMPRNTFLFTNANYLLPYTGAGSGVRRALEYDPNAVFYNGISDSREITHAANEFVITITRTGNQAQSESEQVTNQPESESEQPSDQVAHKTDQASPKSEQPSDQASPKSEQPSDQVTHKTDQLQSETDQVRFTDC